MSESIIYGLNKKIQGFGVEKNIMVICILLSLTFVTRWNFLNTDNFCYLPRIERLLNPGYLINDWFTGVDSPHFFQDYASMMISKVMELSHAYFILTFLSMFLTFVCVSKLSKTTFGSNNGFYLLVIFLMYSFRKELKFLQFPTINFFTIGKNYLIQDGFIPQVLAVALVFLLVYFLDKKKNFFVLSIVTVITTYVHTQYGLLLSIVSSTYFLKSRYFKKIVGYSLIVGLLVFPVGFVSIKGISQHKTDLGDSVLLWILTCRHPQLLALKTQRLSTVFFMALAIVGAASFYKSKKLDSPLFHLMTVSFFMVCIAVFFTEIIPVFKIARLHFIRYAIFVVIPAFLSVFALIGERINGKKLMNATLVLSFICLLWSYHTGYIYLDKHYEGDWADVTRWVKVNTPESSLFIVPQDQEGFRVYAERAVVIDYKCYTFFDSGSVEWFERLMKHSEFSDPYSISCPSEFESLKREYYSLAEKQVLDIQAEYNATHFVSESEYSFQKLYENDKYIVYKL